jgi:hypothetical protein
MERQLETKLDRIVDQTTRIATALEKLAEPPPMIEEEPIFLFVCPHCEKVNPRISSLSEHTSGPSNEFVLKAECDNCHHVLYALPMGWRLFPSRQAVIEAMEEIHGQPN